MSNYQIDADDWDIIIKSSDGELIRCHKYVLDQASGYFENININDETIIIDIDKEINIIRPIIEHIYDSFNKKSNYVQRHSNSKNYNIFINNLNIENIKWPEKDPPKCTCYESDDVKKNMS